MGGSCWFSKGTELSWISNYCISLVEKQSKVKTFARRINRHDISPSGLWPVELKMEFSNFVILPLFWCRLIPKEHFYQIIFGSDRQIRRRRFFKFGHFVPFLMPQQPKFSMEFKSLNNFERGTKEHSCDVWWKLFLRLRRRWCLKLKVNDGWRTQSDQNSSPWAFGSWWSKKGHNLHKMQDRVI